jgi:hypothetical protein
MCRLNRSPFIGAAGEVSHSACQKSIGRTRSCPIPAERATFGLRLRRQGSWAWKRLLEFECDSPAQLLELRWKSIEQETLDSE